LNKIRMGMVGGGPDAFIGAIHRMAANLDGNIELVCGAFSRDAGRSKDFGAYLGLNPNRVYENFDSMFSTEAKLPENERMQFVSVVTPNNSHYEIVDAALTHGFHVMCDKPATLTLQESRQLQASIIDTGLLFGLTHTYTGYPMVKEARIRIERGDLGPIRKVVTEYHQGWLAKKVVDESSKQAAWRLDPEQAGVSCCMGDIGVHAANLAEYITGLEISEIFADLGEVEDLRQLDDDGTVLLRFGNGARGVLMASQISLGEENCLRIRVYGDKGALEWQQEEPNTLLLKWGDEPVQILRAGQGYLSEEALQNSRTPPGHPEGYIEAFANLYVGFATAISDRESGDVNAVPLDVPGINAAIRGMAFIEQVATNSAEGGRWEVLSVE
jgi:predicted dehydrogenase